MFEYIESLLQYGLKTGLINEEEKVYSRNLILDLLREDGFEACEPIENVELAEILKVLTDEAVKRGLIADSGENRDIFDTKLMNCLTPRPSEVRRRFARIYAESPKAATDWFYRFSGDTNYIRRDRIIKDRKWTVDSEYGEIDITINLSKPEKDPRDIAAAGKAKSSAYPKCQLCAENEGYAGRIGHPARANHRLIPLDLSDDSFFFQYSPYVYYNEHCIVFNRDHVPMAINGRAFTRLLEFTEKFPHYFIGSNADLPIVGGSILSHDHFQGGHYTFAMERAEIEEYFKLEGFADIECGIVKWPMSVIRIRGEKPERLRELAVRILEKWRGYSDETAMIFAETNGEPHNTITPIARRRGELFELDLCLRNNLTTEQFPMGLYHPHPERHHIKKENIGLIEVMGLAVLPARLDRELSLLEELIADGQDLRQNAETEKHAEWAEGFAERLKGKPREEIRSVLEQEVGKVFVSVLEDAGVYKRDESGKAIETPASERRVKGDPREQRRDAMLALAASFANAYGIAPNGDLFQVLSIGTYRKASETIVISSPFLAELRRIADSKKHPLHRYLHSSVVNEKNQAAVELANQIIIGVVQRGYHRLASDRPVKKRTVEHTGKDGAKTKTVYEYDDMDDKTPAPVVYRVQYQTLIDKCPLLLDELKEAKSVNAYNRKLQLTFEAAFRIIETKSDLPKHYKNLSLPMVRRTRGGKKVMCYESPTKSTTRRNLIITHDGRP